MHRIAETLPTLSRQQGYGLVLQHRNTPTILRHSRRHYDTGLPRKKGGAGKAVFLTVAAAATVSGGVLAYARYDDKFRKQLTDSVPGSEALMKFIFSDGKPSASDKNSNQSGSMLNSIYKMVGKDEKEESAKAVTAPPPLLKPKPVPDPVTPKKENPTSTSTKVKEEKPRVPEKKSPTLEKENSKSTSLEKYNIPRLEKETEVIVLTAINGFNAALKSLQEYRDEVADLIEKTVNNEDHNIWFRIKEKTQQKDRLLQAVESTGDAAMKKIEHLQLLISDPKTDLEPEVKSKIENRMKDILNDLVFTKALYNQEKTYSSVTDKFSKKVEESRQLLTKELGILFPSLLVDSELVLSDEDLNLFVLYSCQLINFYQKELQKLETLGRAQIDKCIELSKAGNPEGVREIINVETERIRRELAQEVLKKELKLKSDFEKELRTQIRRQAEAHADHIDEIFDFQENEMRREMVQKINETIESMNIEFNRDLAGVLGRIKGIDEALKARATSEKQAKHSQLLWTACQSLNSKLKSATNTKPWNEQLKPLENEVNAISKAAAEEDIFVCAVVNAIPEEAKKRGVFSELALRDRFLNVEKIAYRVANLPEGFISLPRIYLSYLQSFLLIKTAKPIPSAELLNEPFDVSALDNYDILSRARYWLDRGDFEQCLKYMNLLKGAARSIANEWIHETRIFLETQQAANLLLSHAVYSSLVYLQNTS